MPWKSLSFVTKLKLFLIHAIEGRYKEMIVTLFSTVMLSIFACTNNFHLDWHFRYTTSATKEIVLLIQKLTEFLLTSCQAILSGNWTIWERFCFSKKMLTALGDLWFSEVEPSRKLLWQTHIATNYLKSRPLHWPNRYVLRGVKMFLP